jgi:hypothetical protein
MGFNMITIKEINLLDEGVLILRDCLMMKDERLSAHYFKGDEEILVEDFGRVSGKKEVIAKIVENHMEELSGTLRTLNEYKKPLHEAVQDGTFFQYRQRFIYNQFDYTDDQNKIVLTVQMGVQCKQVFVVYILPNKVRHYEKTPIHVLDDLTRGLKEISQEFQEDLSSLFNYLRQSGKTLSSSLADETFFHYRHYQKMHNQIEVFIDSVTKYQEMVGKICEWPASEKAGVVMDRDITLDIIMQRLLSRSKYCKEEIPTIPNMIDAFVKVRKLRARNIDNIQICPRIEYYLYSYQTLVASKVNGIFTILKPELYVSCLQEPSSIEILETMAPSIMSVIFEKHLYGNWTKVAGHLNNEIMKWSQEDRAIIFKNPSLSPKILKYLQGQISLDEIEITPINALEILTQIKFVDQMILTYNWIMPLNKYQIERCSYELKARVLELVPAVKSHQVFTKTLLTTDLAFCLRHIDPRRAGLHAKEISKTFVKVFKLSSHLKKILGWRGNTGSGKSTVAPEGSLNVDHIKAGLKRGYKFLNPQIHPEGAKIFEKLLEEIIKKHRMNYSLDARLIEPEYLESSIILPAAQRQVPAVIEDYEVPLTTSLLRVLTRDRYGKDPCPTLEAIVDGYIRLRKDRAEVIKKIKDAGYVESYHLFFKKGSKRVVVAVKKEGEFKILNEALYNESLREPSKEEIEGVVKQVISLESICQAIDEVDIYPHQGVLLMPFIGMSFIEAYSQ